MMLLRCRAHAGDELGAQRHGAGEAGREEVLLLHGHLQREVQDGWLGSMGL